MSIQCIHRLTGVSCRQRTPSQNSRLYKVVVIGEIHCGKSCLIRRYVHNFYSENYAATLGVDFKLKLIPYNEDLEVRLQLWDVAGQERFSSMTRAYFRGTMGAVVVFDQTNAYTYTAALEKWKKDLDSKCSLPGNRPVPAILVANKCDLRRDPSLPDDLEITRSAIEHGFVPKWFKVSAKTGLHVDDLMNQLVKYIMAMDTWSQPSEHDTSSGSGSGLHLGDKDVISLTSSSSASPEKKNSEGKSSACSCN